ncbi:glycine cleavage system H protein-like protein [Xylaria nigripes]|nr:glycine cleavage system H protein-like protein [Xylaria nigripes]
MASIARCLRAARPSTLSRLSQTSRVRPSWQATSVRAFSASPIRDIRKYTKEHEWVDLNADQTEGVIGISQYAAEELGDVVYVEMPEKGREFLAGDTLGAVESVKSAADIGCPIAGTVVATNKLLEEKPSTASQVPEDDSHGGGWIVKISVDEQGRKDFAALMDLKEYQEYTGSQDH